MRLPVIILLMSLLAIEPVHAVNKDSLRLSKIDSLQAVLKGEIHDTTRAIVLNSLSITYGMKERDKAIEYAEYALDLSKRKGYPFYGGKASHFLGKINYFIGDHESAERYWKSACEYFIQASDSMELCANIGNLGILKMDQGDYNEALENYTEARRIAKLVGNRSVEAANLTNIGIVNRDQGNFGKAIEYYFQALTVQEEMGEKNMMAGTYGNIGLLYTDQLDFDKAIEYHQKALALNRETDNIRGQAANLVNIGIVLREKGENEQALKYYFQSLELNKQIGRRLGIAINMGNIGTAYQGMGDKATDEKEQKEYYTKALEYFFNALGANQEIGRKTGITISLSTIGWMYHRLGNQEEAKRYLMEAKELSRELGTTNLDMSIHKKFAKVYEEEGDYKNAFESFKLHTAYKDSLFNEDKSKDIGKLEAKFEFEKAEEEKMRMEKEEQALLEAEEKRRNNLQYSGILMVIVVLAMSLFTLGRFNLSVRMVEGVIFFTFLLFFEFTLVLLDPYIEQFSRGEPAYKLLFNALLAGMIFPLHSFFEEKVKKRVT